MHALGQQDLMRARAVPAILRNEIRFGCFFEGKKVTKGACNAAKLATQCISILLPQEKYKGNK